MNKILHRGQWLSLMRTPDGYEYISYTSARHGVAVLAYSLNPISIVGRYERCPAHGVDDCLIIDYFYGQ